MANGDGTFDIAYEDGQVETSVGTDLIREPTFNTEENELITPLSEMRAAGETAVVVDEETPAETTADNHRGEEQNGVSPEEMREVDVTEEGDIIASQDTHNFNQIDGAFDNGVNVEVRFGGGYDWYGGTITMANGDGTFDIAYEDGQVETSVGTDLIREPTFNTEENELITPLSEMRAAGETAVVLDEEMPAETTADNRAEYFYIGMRVETIFDGGEEWYSSTITMANEDGTFDVVYDDGQVESGILFDFIRQSSYYDGEVGYENTLEADVFARYENGDLQRDSGKEIMYSEFTDQSSQGILNHDETAAMVFEEGKESQHDNLKVRYDFAEEKVEDEASKGEKKNCDESNSFASSEFHKQGISTDFFEEIGNRSPANELPPLLKSPKVPDPLAGSSLEWKWKGAARELHVPVGSLQSLTQPKEQTSNQMID